MCPQMLATWPNGEWGYSTRRDILEPVRPEAVLPETALCLPTFSHFLIDNKISLSLSLPETPMYKYSPGDFDVHDSMLKNDVPAH